MFLSKSSKCICDLVRKKLKAKAFKHFIIDPVLKIDKQFLKLPESMFFKVVPRLFRRPVTHTGLTRARFIRFSSILIQSRELLFNQTIFKLTKLSFNTFLHMPTNSTK